MSEDLGKRHVLDIEEERDIFVKWKLSICIAEAVLKVQEAISSIVVYDKYLAVVCGI